MYTTFKDKHRNKILETLIMLGLNKYYDSHSYTYHMCKMALCAEKDGFSKNVVLACFLFRIGYLIEFNNNSHISNLEDYGELGYNYLKKLGVSKDILEIVSNYIDIKRYNYYKNIETNYVKLVRYNGGMMDKFEAEQYEKKNILGLLLNIDYYEEINPTYIELDESNCLFQAIRIIGLL